MSAIDRTILIYDIQPKADLNKLLGLEESKTNSKDLLRSQSKTPHAKYPRFMSCIWGDRPGHLSKNSQTFEKFLS
jgi:hypothetical protein